MGWILAACGAVAVAPSVVTMLRVRRVLKQGATAQGIVVGREEASFGDSGYRGHPVIAFTTDDGRAVRFTSRIGYNFGGPDEGTALPVRYLLEDPERAEWDRSRTWIGPLVWLALGLGLLVAGVVIYARG
jgi:hypothetical protein